MTMVTFSVDGVPVQQGSMKAFVNPKSKRAIVTHDNSAQLRSWRQDVAVRAREARNIAGELLQQDGGVVVMACFRFVRPRSVPARRRPTPEVAPDLDKLTRALLDALTGVLFHDDAQVVRLMADKVYADSPGLTCSVGPRHDMPGMPDPVQLDLLGAIA